MKISKKIPLAFSLIDAIKKLKKFQEIEKKISQIGKQKFLYELDTQLYKNFIAKINDYFDMSQVIINYLNIYGQ